jgi:hypothetical protein
LLLTVSCARFQTLDRLVERVKLLQRNVYHKVLFPEQLVAYLVEHGADPHVVDQPHSDRAAFLRAQAERERQRDVAEALDDAKRALRSMGWQHDVTQGQQGAAPAPGDGKRAAAAGAAGEADTVTGGSAGSAAGSSTAAAERKAGGAAGATTGSAAASAARAADSSDDEDDDHIDDAAEISASLMSPKAAAGGSGGFQVSAPPHRALPPALNGLSQARVRVALKSARRQRQGRPLVQFEGVDLKALRPRDQVDAIDTSLNWRQVCACGLFVARLLRCRDGCFDLFARGLSPHSAIATLHRVQAEVLSSGGGSSLIHYHGFSSQWREFVADGSARLALPFKM